MKFNLKPGYKVQETVNYENEKCFVLSPQLELYTTVATASLNDQFYQKAAQKLVALREVIAKNDPGFVARLAVYAREQMHLRSIPVVLAVELAKQHRGDGLVSKLVNRMVQRADEIAELLAYYTLANERKEVKQLNKLSKQLQKGLAEAFNKFDEYQFAKYNRDAKVRLKDALFLVHPKAKDEAKKSPTIIIQHVIQFFIIGLGVNAGKDFIGFYKFVEPGIIFMNKQCIKDIGITCMDYAFKLNDAGITKFL